MWPPLSWLNPVYAELTANRNADGEPADPAAITAAWKHGSITVRELAREHLRLIDEDILAGKIPWNRNYRAEPQSWQELRKHVDPDTYTLKTLGLDQSDDGTALASTVRQLVDDILIGTRSFWRDQEPRPAAKNRPAVRRTRPDHGPRSPHSP